MKLNYTLSSVSGRLGAVLALALVAGGPLAAAAAETVVLHRGASVARVVLGGQDLKIGRGPAILSRPQIRKAVPVLSKIVAGERLWLLDAESGELSVCTLRATTQVGPDAIRCRTRDLPRGLY